MNNSFFAIESVSLSMDDSVDITETLKEREGKILRIIEAIQEVKGTKAWDTLGVEIFDGLVAGFENKLAIESRREEPDTLKLNRLAGQLEWAERYADLDKLESVFRVELSNIRKKYGNN